VARDYYSVIRVSSQRAGISLIFGKVFKNFTFFQILNFFFQILNFFSDFELFFQLLNFFFNFWTFFKFWSFVYFEIVRNFLTNFKNFLSISHFCGFSTKKYDTLMTGRKKSLTLSLMQNFFQTFYELDFYLHIFTNIYFLVSSLFLILPFCSFVNFLKFNFFSKNF